jgi:predicted CXXCH cytochrome family protein
MPAGERKTKVIGKRIDLSYHKQPSPMRSLRRLTVILCGLAAALWGGWALFARNGERAYNPGPVAGVHAMFEIDCAACHDGGSGNGSEPRGSGKFLKTVSDAACLKCHNASIHADKQISLVSLDNGKPAMSSNCTTCHVEHKGHDAMAGTSDALCTRCHDNLTVNVAGNKTDLQSSVKSFDKSPAHPAFGRVLRQGGNGIMSDPTPLKFNHKKHLSGINPNVGDCSTCHHLSPTGDQRIMEPVSFEANCKSCHPLSLAPGLPDVPHEPMEVVRLFTDNVPARVAQRLANMTPEEKKSALTIEKRNGLKKEIKILTEAEWLDAQTKPLVDKLASSSAADLPSYKSVNALEGPAKTAASLELYAAYGMTTSCSYCHTLAGNPAPVAKSTPDLLHVLPTGYHPDRTATATATAAATAVASPATMPAMAMPATRPTATPEGRRWFTASVFDHQSHRSANCTDCHAQATSSTLTSDVLLPDMQTCVSCHHPGGRDQQAASNNCVTCHIYHDRGNDTAPVKGRGIDLLLGKGKPMASAK